VKVQLFANYQNENKLGTIRISRIDGNKAVEYTLQLFETSLVPIKKTKFPSMDAAISYASSYGYSTHLWVIEEN